MSLFSCVLQHRISSWPSSLDLAPGRGEKDFSIPAEEDGHTVLGQLQSWHLLGVDSLAPNAEFWSCTYNLCQCWGMITLLNVMHT